MIRCLVVDDDPLARLVLQRFIGELAELELVASCGSAAEAGPFLENGEVGLVFLDFDLPDASGLDILRTGAPLPTTILVTGARDMAVQALEAGAAACLVKPLSFDVFAEVVAEVVAQVVAGGARDGAS